LTSRLLSRKISEFALSKKATHVVLLDLTKLTTTTDFFIICSADSEVQVRAIADAIEDGMEELDTRVWHIEGKQASTWVLMDYVDVVVHVFHKESRKFYNIERLWNDAVFYDVHDEPSGVKVTKRKTVKLEKSTTKKPTKKKSSR
jgi:ribosome-associated protein